MKTTPKWDALMKRKEAVDRELLSADDMPGWVSKPTRDGWWLWSESQGRTELILLTAQGHVVANDRQWEAATGMPAEQHGFFFNYWEDTDTTKRMMPGEWLFLEAA